MLLFVCGSVLVVCVDFVGVWGVGVWGVCVCFFFFCLFVFKQLMLKFPNYAKSMSQRYMQWIRSDMTGTECYISYMSHIKKKSNLILLFSFPFVIVYCVVLLKCMWIG